MGSIVEFDWDGLVLEFDWDGSRRVETLSEEDLEESYPRPYAWPYGSSTDESVFDEDKDGIFLLLMIVERMAKDNSFDGFSKALMEHGLRWTQEEKGCRIYAKWLEHADLDVAKGIMKMLTGAEMKKKQGQGQYDLLGTAPHWRLYVVQAAFEHWPKEAQKILGPVLHKTGYYRIASAIQKSAGKEMPVGYWTMLKIAENIDNDDWMVDHVLEQLCEPEVPADSTQKRDIVRMAVGEPYHRSGDILERLLQKRNLGLVKYKAMMVMVDEEDFLKEKVCKLKRGSKEMVEYFVEHVAKWRWGFFGCPSSPWPQQPLEISFAEWKSQRCSHFSSDEEEEGEEQQSKPWRYPSPNGENQSWADCFLQMRRKRERSSSWRSRCQLGGGVRCQVWDARMRGRSTQPRLIESSWVERSSLKARADGEQLKRVNLKEQEEEEQIQQ